MREVDILREGKAKIEKGWCQGMLYSDRSGEPLYCAVGAIDFMLGRNVTGKKKSSLGYLMKVLGYKGCSSNDFKKIENWNDRGNRKKEDVLATFDMAIALAEADE